MILVTGYPEKDALVPVLEKTPFEETVIHR
jgi:hypothetical protein